VTSPRVSVIVPVFNGELHLPETLDALCSQTLIDIEVLVIDDGSVDRSAQIVRACRDTRVRLVHQDNRGLAHALNRGLAEARAAYVARNDQDDISVPHRLERQLSIMESRPDAKALFAAWTKFGQRRGWANQEKIADHKSGTVRESHPFEDGCLLASTMFARVAALREVGGFRQEYYPSDDWDLQLRLCAAGTVLLINEALVAYRLHLGANTYRLFLHDQDKSRWAEDSYRRRLTGATELPFESFVAGSRQRRWSGWTQGITDRAKLHMRIAGQHYLDGRDGAALMHAAMATVLDPVSVGRRVLAIASLFLSAGSL